MDLQEFIQVSLVQISKGIEAANAELKGSNAMINPRNLAVNAGGGANYGIITELSTKLPRIVELVEFDIAITVSEGTEKNGKIGISVGSVGFGVGGKNTEANSSLSRLKFKIPVAWPYA